jgi:hypothetical protein
MPVSPNRPPARATSRTDDRGPAARRRRIARAATTAAGLAVLTAAGVRPPAAGAQVVYRRVDLGAANTPPGPATESFINFVTGGTYTVETGGAVRGVPPCPGPACNFDLALAYNSRGLWRFDLPYLAGVDPAPVGPGERGLVTDPSQPGGERQLALQLAPGARVGPSSDFDAGHPLDAASMFVMASFAPLGTPHFFGVRFRAEAGAGGPPGAVHYAWVRILSPEGPPYLTATLLDYAYEATPGREIVVGDGLPAAEVVPEPAPLALVAGALVLLGGGAVRRRAGAAGGRRSGR